jgi:hypothetical protein
LESSDVPKRRDRPQRHLECHRCDPGVDQVEDRPWVQGLNDHGGNRRSVKRLGNADRADEDRGDQDLGDRGRGDQSRGDQSRGDQSRGDQDLGDQGRGNPELRRLRWRRPTRRFILQFGTRRGAESSYDYREIPRCLHLHTGSDGGAGSWRPGPARSASSRSRRQRRLRAWPGAAKSRPSRAETRGQRTWQSGPAAFPRRCRGGRGGRGDASKPKTQTNRRRKQTEDASKPKTQTNRRRKAIRKHPELQEVPQGNGHTAGKSTARRRQDPADDGVGRNRSPGRDSSYSCENRAGRCAASRGALESVRSRSWLRRS